jgi:hypothetical protein
MVEGIAQKAAKNPDISAPAEDNPSLCLVLEQLVRWWKWSRTNDAFPMEGGGVDRARIRS